jgi:hypothetical protein
MSVNPKQARIVTHKVTPKLPAKGKISMQFTGANDFPKKEAFCVVVASPRGMVQMTFHHPIGETGLEDDVWVATESDQTHYLFARAKNPFKKTVDAARNIFLLGAAVTSRILDNHEGQYVYHGRNDLGLRQALVNAARRRAKEAGLRDRDSYIQFLNINVQALERRFIEHMASEAAKQAAAEAHPYPQFETRSGLHATTPQVAVGYLNRMPLDEAFEAVLNRLSGD